MKAIGIDIGTTSVCGIVMNIENGRIEKSITENSEAFLEGCAPWEKIQSVDRIMSVAMQILDELTGENIAKNIAVIGVTGQMHGIVYTDREGKAVSPLYTWQDERGNLPWRDTTYAKYLNSFAGYGNVTDFYNKENGIRPAQALHYCTIHDYFVMQLCGRKAPLVHTSDAASLGCFQLDTDSFAYDYPEEVTAQYRIAGEYNGIPVSVAIGDNQASVFSTLAEESDILINVGTGSQISVISDQKAKKPEIETRPYFEGKYLLVGAALCGGRAYSLLKNFYAQTFGYLKKLEDGEIYAIMNAMLKGDSPKVFQADVGNESGKESFQTNVRNESGKEELHVDTRFAGTRQNPEQTGSITGITTQNFTPACLTRGVLCGMAEELFAMYRQMGVTKSGLVGSGNGIRKNKALVKIFEEKFGAGMKIPAHLEEAAFGAALFGTIACGRFRNAAQAQKMIKYRKGQYDGKQETDKNSRVF